MPHISVKLYPGKSEEMKENLAKAVRKALAEESRCMVTGRYFRIYGRNCTGQVWKQRQKQASKRMSY